MEMNISENKNNPFNGVRLSTEDATKKSKLRSKRPLGRSHKNDLEKSYETAQAEEEIDGGIQDVYE